MRQIVIDIDAMASRVLVTYFLVAIHVASIYNGVECLGSEEQTMSSEPPRQPAAMQIKTEYGDIYDCINVDKQPALSHPLLKDHKIQAGHSEESIENMLPQITSKKAQFNVTDTKIGLEKGCPTGTVPIRRYIQQLKQDRSTSKKFRVLHSAKWQHGLEFAGVVTSTNPRKYYYEAGGSISIYNPKVGPDQFSSATIAVESGELAYLNQIQVGWMVNPKLYGDSRTRLYTSWTVDNHQSTGCYNTLCPGFVQVNRNIPLDSVLPDISVFGRRNFDKHFTIAQDRQSGDWWFYLDGVGIGYWPSTLFTTLWHSAETVKWGGQIFTPWSDASSPPMGSGAFHNGNYYKTCYMRQLHVIDETERRIAPDNSFVHTAESRCYLAADNSVKKDPYCGYAFLFGGTGGKEQSTCLY